MANGDARIVLVTRHTRLEELIVRFNTVEQAKFYIEHLGADFADYEAEHRTYQAALRNTETALARCGRVHRLDRGFLPSYLFPPDAIVVVLGQDGLVANSLKYLDGQPVIGVNPDPARWDGVLLPFGPDDMAAVVPEVAAGRRSQKSITFARARLSDGQELLAVNDLFIGPRSHVSARYLISAGDVSEAQSSSGVIVSTGLGSTGGWRTPVTGSTGIAGGPTSEDVVALREHGFAWESDYLYYTVREPFPSRSSQASLVFGRVSAADPLRVTSQMAGHGVIFSDGIENDFVEFNAGMEATIGVAERRGRLVV
jgi:NAD kinase